MSFISKLLYLGAPQWAKDAMLIDCPKCGRKAGWDCSPNARVTYIHKERHMFIKNVEKLDT